MHGTAVAVDSRPFRAFGAGREEHRPSNPAHTAGMFDALPLSPSTCGGRGAAGVALREGRPPLSHCECEGLFGECGRVARVGAAAWRPPAGAPGRWRRGLRCVGVEMAEWWRAW